MRGETPASEGRRWARFPADLPAIVAIDRMRADVRIKDISILGCCLAGTIELKKGDEIVLSVKGLSVVATIAWTDFPLAGATFHKEINPLQVISDNIDHPVFANRRSANSMIALAADR